MISGKWVAPAVLFFAGAVFGRIFGVRPLVKGAITAASMSGLIPDNSGSERSRPPARRVTHRTARKRAPAKRSRAA